MTDYSKEYNEYWSSAGRWGESSFQNPDVIVDQVLATCGGGKLLDVGCGMGSLVRAFLARGIDAYGIDVAIAPIAKSNELTPGRYSTGSILNIPYDNDSFDTVCCTDCLEHLTEEDIPIALKELYRVTKRHLYISISTLIDRDEKWHLTVQDRNWWENRFFESGLRKHSLFFEATSFEGLENEQGTLTLLFDKIPTQVLDKYPLVALQEERTLHMDMQRESGRRSEAHCVRYAFFKRFIRHNDTVVDAACGLGYGAAIIWDSSLASKVIGLDNSQSAIEYAKENYCPERNGLEFHCCDITRLSEFRDSSIDVVFSFETLEHIHDPSKFLKEVYRILTPGGRFICSVPNMWVDETGKDPNPYHYHLFDYNLLKDLCGNYFIVEEIYSQVGGGGMKLWDHPRKITKVEVSIDNKLFEAEWWLLVGMKDPLIGQKEKYIETSFPDHTGKNLNIVSWWRDYENPWIVRALVQPDWRLQNPDQLQTLIKHIIEGSSSSSADTGAALCVSAYRILEKEVAELELRDIIARLHKYIADVSNSTNPHVLRWKISNQFVLARLIQSTGDLETAAHEFWKCSCMDFSGFSPLIATKTVEASFLCGWILSNIKNDYELAKKAWMNGLAIAHKAVNGPWDEIIGSFAEPFEFGMHEITQVLDFASKCSNALVYIEKMKHRPGRVTPLIFSNFSENLNRLHTQHKYQNSVFESELNKYLNDYDKRTKYINDIEEELQKFVAAWDERGDYIRHIEADLNKYAAICEDQKAQIRQFESKDLFTRLKYLFTRK